MSRTIYFSWLRVLSAINRRRRGLTAVIRHRDFWLGKARAPRLLRLRWSYRLGRCSRDPWEPMTCRCGWLGPARQVISGYTAAPGGDVDPVDRCPHCWRTL